MSRPAGAAAPGDGVYYRLQDYAGFFRRLCIELIDLAVAVGLWLCVLFVAFALIPDDDPPWWPAELLLAVVAFAYFVLLKRSPIPTLGYKVCAARLVTLQGARPGIPALSVRFLFSLIGPVNFLLDLLWIPSDEHRQTLRDKFAHTYVVKAGSQPQGRGTLVYSRYHILGMAFIFLEVRRPRPTVTSPRSSP